MKASESMQFSVAGTALLLAVLISQASDGASQCASDGSPRLRFVAQLSVSGCPVFVHDTGAKDGPHLEIEPLMCVRANLTNLKPKFDFITQQIYVSVPVLLRDEGVLEEARRQLQHLSPKSVKFSTVSDFSVSTYASSRYQALTFVWSPEESVGFLWISCLPPANCSCFSVLNSSNAGVLDAVLLSSTTQINGSVMSLDYRLLMQNNSYFEPELHIPRYQCLPNCSQLRFQRSVLLENCTARVHQRMDMKGHFLIEPLLCHNITSLSSEPVMYDYNRDMYYLKLDVVLQDEASADAVRTQLADLEPRSMSFMRLWRSQIEVGSALRARFEIGPLLVSGDGRSAQLRVFCREENICLDLRTSILSEPIVFWRHVKWSVESLLVPGQCLMRSPAARHSWRMKDAEEVGVGQLKQSNPFVPYKSRHRKFILIQQRLTGNVSFQRGWSEYEEGFGDSTDFWVGLRTIHSLTGSRPRLLRVEIVTRSAVLYVAEYSGFSVAGASTDYTMTFRDYLTGRSNTTRDSLSYHRGRKFSTMDRDNDNHPSDHCSQSFGNAGWWFGTGYNCNPNGLYPTSAARDARAMYWLGALKSIRLMVLDE